MIGDFLLFQENHVTSREHAARRLRELADQIEATTFALGDHQVALPDEVGFTIEVDREHDTRAPRDEFQFELELELAWRPWAGMRDTMPAA